MMDAAEIAVDAALAAGADYADARACRTSRESLTLRNGALASARAPDEAGLGVRVLKGGVLGFAAAPATPAEASRVARELGRRAARVAADLAPARGEPVVLAGSEGEVGEYATPVEIDPFRVPLEEKLDLLRSADAALQGAPETVVRLAHLGLRRREQFQASSEGARVHQVLVRSGGGIASTAAAHGQTERRSHPATGGDFRSGGFEHVLSLDLAAHGARVRDEAVALCAADPCPAGRRTLIAGGNPLALQIHESVGHATELDRVLGHEADLAGHSFATVDKLGSFRYGSPIVDLVADSTVPGGLDTRAFDDECVPSGRWHVVAGGILVGYHTSREWAGRLGEARSRAAARAEGWYDPPILRITNLSLEPGEWTLEALIADTEDGAILVDGVKTWSIDERRLNFQFTCEIGREIRGGELGRILRSPTYQGSTPEFWRSCDAICNAQHWALFGITNCAKGNPMQAAEMSHGAAPARFRDVLFVR